MGNPFSKPKIPKPPAAPPPADEVAPMLREISRRQTEQSIKRNNKQSFLGSTGAYQAPGKTTTGS
jgi:hypothetical protein